MRLKDFILTKYKLNLKIKDELHLPRYIGSTLRGGFGNSFRRIVCFHRGMNCTNCLLKEKCVYAYIFETSPPKDSDRLKKSRDIPRPFIIEPPINGKQEYKENEILEFGLTLIGRAIDYLPYFIVTFKELGNIGIGRSRGKYFLEKVTSKGQEIYSSQEEALKWAGEKISFSEILDEAKGYPTDRLNIDFITPTRMKFNKKCVLVPEFHILIRSLLQRVSSLSYFHCGEELSLDFKAMINRAGEVRIEENKAGWFDWEKYSGRQEVKMKLGGIVGKVSYSGNIKEFLPLIALGRYVHVGKGATFGLGKYGVCGVFVDMEGNTVNHDI